MKHPQLSTPTGSTASPARGSSWTRAAQPATRGSSWTRAAQPATRGSSWTREARATRGSSWTREAQTTRGSSWTRSAKRVGVLLTAGAAALAPTAGAAFAASTPSVHAVELPAAFVVRAAPGHLAEVQALVLSSGGSVTRSLTSLQTIGAQLTPSAAARVRQSPLVSAVLGDTRVKLAGAAYDASADAGSLYDVRSQISATSTAALKATGSGVDVALIDSGVARVPGIAADRVINGPDLSFESNNADLRYLDTYGHGTHMAGIILGSDGRSPGDPASFEGVAPSARLVSLKVADARGASDVTQVLAAIDWVIANKQTNGLNIKVLNLSFGTDSSQGYQVDPLAQAVEVAWANGITVITSAGNQGSSSGHLTLPAVDPRVIAVGASDAAGTADRADDKVASFSSRGDGTRNPDLVAPGRSIQSLRVPGSYIDATYGSTGTINDRFFRGSGTSQAAAVVSGAAADLLSAHPSWSPDQVKAALTQTAVPLTGATAVDQGAGALDLGAALAANPTAALSQSFAASTGEGSIDASRGSMRLSLEGKVLDGEQDIHGKKYDSKKLAKDRAKGKSFKDGKWNDTEWTDKGFTGQSWDAKAWKGSSWAGSSWAGSSWASGHWTGSSWADSNWSGSSWAGSSWAGSSWAGSSWAGSSWAGSSWASGSWD